MAGPSQVNKPTQHSNDSDWQRATISQRSFRTQGLTEQKPQHKELNFGDHVNQFIHNIKEFFGGLKNADKNPDPHTPGVIQGGKNRRALENKIINSIE